MGFKMDTRSILEGLVKFELKSRAAMGLYADTAGKKLEAEAKKSATWINRTGMARKTIKGGKQWEGDKCHVYVCGNEEHSPYLELCNDKKYAILKPTVDKLSPEILRGLNNLLR
ncbi:hypothetical protein [Clostridium tagluense]|uniref:hypothetical protein n=1 Tax=Clostridium tagluense TaxID=360422 RepID=UPI001CF2C15E|nr:hypothetical protein [Clostridium tagluense]MCB2300393.1 hypothetical protein [Clostridium tagluense]